MTKLGVLVGEDENWTFFKEIFEDLDSLYPTQVYKGRTYNLPLLSGRLNRWAFHEGIRSILHDNDICFFEWASELLMYASQMSKHCPIVTRLHSFELYDWAPKINWDHVDRVILVSEAMRQKFIDLYPDHAHKTRVIYNGKPLDKFKPPSQRIFNFNLGMLCNIHPVKRVYEVVLMLYNLKQQGYEACLHIAGKPHGDLRYVVAVHRLVEKLNLRDDVIFYDYVATPQAWLEKIDIFISNSYWEGHQVALVEAMATSCYCLSHFWDGAEEVVPPENLYATEVELEQKIIEYANQPEQEKRQHQVQMRAIACEKFDINQTISQIRQVVEEVNSMCLNNGQK
jgi:glycosyltransferase involved in cell wall biosynthesis